MVRVLGRSNAPTRRGPPPRGSYTRRASTSPFDRWPRLVGSLGVPPTRSTWVAVRFEQQGPDASIRHADLVRGFFVNSQGNAPRGVSPCHARHCKRVLGNSRRPWVETDGAPCARWGDG